ncbi:uncharacterized protein F4812DRAFT_181819 [Daldinia caldariorum]|uniref:uncharacterized protein n=1 Tax=Daldinia caldariorum TaxID=326644 RepID=UPI002007386C|nr:uncharacterized protein F4812DRAFT_181819 [Daldinia caldariorum]KAI1471523.1 hypothetical protein F4812DRAFT_181819 [Daldinia caldariorum]
MAGTVTKNFLRHWHKLLGLRRQSRLSWHRARLREELLERRDAKSALDKLSETAGVFFAISRATYEGFPVRTLPRFAASHLLVYVYMMAKYTSRWAFYRLAAFLCGAPGRGRVREVMNPAKDSKLDEVASRHNIDKHKFRRVGRRLRRVWPLFP